MPDGYILQPSYRIRDGVAVVQLFGRLEDGRAFCVEDDRFRPYFFVRAEDADALRDTASVRIGDAALRSFGGHALARVEAATPGDVPALRDRLAQQGRPHFESDVRFPYRYLIDAGVRAGVAIDGEATERDGLVWFRNPALTPAAVRPQLRVLSLDLETDPRGREIRSAALVGDDADEVHLAGRGEITGATAHADERALLRAVAERIRALDPDVITGWNVIDFDLQLIAKRQRELRVGASLGRVPGEMRFQQEMGFTRQTRGTLPGRILLDALPVVRDALRLEDYRLETVARHVLGRGKLLSEEVADPAAEIDRLYREEPEALVAYNREDARLVLEILEHEGLLALSLERSLLTGMPLDRVGASIASFDRLYLPALRKRGYAAPSVDSSRKSAQVRGGAVLDSRPGFFENVAVFDFKSLYPSLIRTFQLDPLAHVLADDAPNPIQAPGGARFAREGALLPEILEGFAERRDAAKARGDRNADQAIKIMMNALFGVLGAASCRFFDPAIANAITGFGQEMLARTRAAFEDEGVEVIYGDTDSVFVLLAADGSDGSDQAAKLRERVQTRIAAWVEETHGVTSHLDLELEKVYDRFFLPRVRGGTSGSKKRYAGRVDGRLAVVGLESVRRDWPAIAGHLQRGMLERAFDGDTVVPFVREVVNAVRAGERDAELVYVKRLRKGSLDRYTQSAPPHVQAARKAGPRAGPVIRYLVTQRGPEPVLPGQPLPDDIDRAHYVDRVLRPLAEAVLTPLGEHTEDALGEPRQLGLL
ncbi:MAG: DNA polymerase II [Myxococcota bacterium]